MARIALLAVLLLALPASALGGGFATVQLSSLPEGTPAGGTWSVELTVLQHGRTPLEDVAPVVRVRGPAGTQEFPARPAGRPGVYAADVVFPEEGTYRYEIWDGFTQTHTYAPVSIADGGEPAAPGGERSFPLLPVAAGGAAALLLAALGVVAARRRRADGPPVAQRAS